MGRPKEPQNWSHAGGVSTLIITRRNGDKHKVTIDTADYDAVKHWRWHTIPDSIRYYCAATHWPEPRRKASLLLHRLILGDAVGEGQCVVWRNNNPLDCRRANMTVGTRLDAMQERYEREPSSLGQFIYPHRGGYRVAIVIYGKPARKWYKTLPEAIRWRDATLAAHGFRCAGNRRVRL